VSDSIEWPECRYCGSTEHNSREFELCILEHQAAGESGLATCRAHFDISPDIGEKKLKECNPIDLMAMMDRLCPFGYLAVVANTEELGSGSEIALLMTVSPQRAIKMAKFVIAASHQRLKDDNKESPND